MEEPDAEDSRGGKRRYAQTIASEEDKYKIYFKANYTRLFLEKSAVDYTVYIESKEKEKIGNRNPIKLTQLFVDNIKGITSVYRINGFKIGVTFQKAAAANSFLKQENFLSKHKLRAFIPAHLVEKVGIIKYVPTDMSNEEIYKNITCDADILSVKRFMKKDASTKQLIPMTTVAITFSTTTLPKSAFLSLFRYQIHPYIPPLVQCYKCFKFNHSAKVCRGAQMCSSCAGAHSYKECDSENLICINCGGSHLAISRDCPIKKNKIEEKRKQIYGQNRSFASVVGTTTVDNINFPPLKQKLNVTNTASSAITTASQNKKDESKVKQLDVEQIANNEIILNAIVKSLIALANSKSTDAMTSSRIKDIFLSNLL